MTRLRLIPLAAILALSSIPSIGQSSDKEYTPTTIGVGDLLQVKVFHTPDLDTQGRLDDSGTLSLPLIGAVNLAGLTPQQAGREISHRYTQANYIDNLDVSVLVVENASQRVSVLGEVKNPGSVALLPRMRLLDVISAAGGLQATASGIVSVSHRQTSIPAQTYKINGSLAGAENPEIRPGDIIQAERAGIVYVVGAVNRAGGFVLENGKTVSILQALALAEGHTSTAKLGQACLIRTVNGNRTIEHINIKSLLRNQLPDQALQADDILFIPSSQFKEVVRGGAQGAIDMAASLSIYHI